MKNFLINDDQNYNITDEDDLIGTSPINLPDISLLEYFGDDMYDQLSP